PPEHPDDPAGARQPLTPQQGDGGARQGEELPRYELPVHALEGQNEHSQRQPRKGQPLERDRRAVSGERPPERRQRRGEDKERFEHVHHDDLPTSAGSPGAPWPRPWRTDRSRATSGRIRTVRAEVYAPSSIG